MWATCSRDRPAAGPVAACPPRRAPAGQSDYDQNSILVNSHLPTAIVETRRSDADAESSACGFSGVQEQLNGLGENSSAIGVEMNAVYVELPTVDPRDLIKAWRRIISRNR
jgi:hypothetical protein